MDKEAKDKIGQLIRKQPQEKTFVQRKEHEIQEAQREEDKEEEEEKNKKQEEPLDEEEQEVYIPEGYEDISVPELKILSEEELIEMVSKILTTSDRNPNEGTTSHIPCL
jgi:hypothetical protein